MACTLSRLPNNIERVGILNQTLDTNLFILEPKWLQNVYEYLIKIVMLGRLTIS
jgi:hypothetical protein